jgi:gliding motility-associated-like protein
MNSDAGGNIILSGLTAGNYTDFIAELLGCPTTDNQVIVLVDPNAPNVTAGANQTICEPGSVTLTATNPDGAIITWDNGVTDGIAFNPAVGTLTYTVTANLAGCISTDILDVTVNPLPVVSAGANQTVCEGTAVTLIANNPNGAIITWDNGVTNLTPFVPGVGTVTYTVTADLLTCITTDVVDVTVNPLPVFTVAGTDPSTCGGTEGFITISGLDPSTAYQITYNDGNIVGPTAMNSDAGGSIIISGLTAGNYTDFVVALLGCSTTDNQIITLVDPNAPGINAGANQTICEPGVVTLTATNPDGAIITWDNGITDGVAFNPNIGTLTYIVTANLAGCISNDQVDVTVNPLPIITAPVDAVICDGDVISLIANNPDAASLSWDNGITDGIGFTPAVGTLTYTVTANLLGCISTDAVDITVNPLGNPGFSYPSYTFCSVDTDPIASIDVAGGSFAFTTVSGGPNLVIDLNTGAVDLDASNQGVYDITYTTVGACPQDSTVTMTISLTPTVNPILNDTVCHNEDFTFININGSAGATFSWINDNASIGLAASGNGNTIPNFPGINVTLAPQVANLTVTPTAGSCVGATTSFVLVVNPLDNPGFNYPVTDFCTTGNNPTPIIDVAGGTFSSFTTQGAGTIDINPITGEVNLVNSDAGEYDITYTTAGPDCPQDSTINLTIYLTPVINSIPDQTVCEGDQFLTVDFTGTANPSFTWTNNNINIGLDASGNGDILPWNTTSGGGLEIATITVTPFTAECVGADSTFTLSVNPLDNNGFNYPDFNYCTTDPVDPIPSIDVPGGLFTFTVVNGGPNLIIDAATGTIDLDLSDEGVYAINYETVGPCVQDSTLTMTINFTPTVDPLIDITVCHGADFNIAPFTGLSGNLPTTFDWVNSDPQIGLAGNGNTDIATFTANNVNAGQIGGIVSVTPSTDLCIGTPTSFNLIVDPLDDPSFEYVDGLTYCLTGTDDPITNITGTAGGTFSFTINQGGPLVLDANTGEVDLSASSVGSYEITYLTNAACPQSSTLTLVITDAPVADFIIGDYCSNVADENVTYLNNGSGGLFTASPAGIVINQATGLIDLDASTTGTYTITNTIDLTAQGCVLAVATDDITIFEIPTAVISGTTTLCPSDPLPDVTVDFTVNGPYNLDYTFNGNSLTENGTASPFIISSAQFGDYEIVQVTDFNGCVVALSGTVSIDSFATPTVNQLYDYSICEGSDLTIDNFSGTPNGNTFDWTIPSGVDIGFGIIGVGNIGTFTATTPTAVPVTVEVTPTSTNGCIGSLMIFDVDVNPLPVISFYTPVTEGCEPFEVNFSSITIDGDKCFWDFGDGFTSSGCGIQTHVYETAGVYDVTLTVLSTDNCTASLTLEGYITVTPTPTAAFTFTPPITDISNTEIEFINNSSPAEEYEWNFGDESAFSYQTDPIHIYGDVPEQYEIRLVASNNGGLCADTAYAYLTVEDILLYYVPNVFTPDADTYNETFQPIFTSGFDPFDYHLMIFNRWGELIFESYNSTIGWDGTYPEDGKLAQDGVYVWKIEFKETMSDKRHKLIGHVTLLK